MIKVKLDTDKLEIEVYKDGMLYYQAVGGDNDGPMEIEINGVPLFDETKDD